MQPHMLWLPVGNFHAVWLHCPHASDLHGTNALCMPHSCMYICPDALLPAWPRNLALQVEQPAGERIVFLHLWPGAGFQASKQIPACLFPLPVTQVQQPAWGGQVLHLWPVAWCLMHRAFVQDSCLPARMPVPAGSATSAGRASSSPLTCWTHRAARSGCTAGMTRWVAMGMVAAGRATELLAGPCCEWACRPLVGGTARMPGCYLVG